MIREDRKYSESHEWVKVEGDVATIGISDHAQDALGDITFVELPNVNDTVTKGKECGVIESVKAASDLNAPISGTVTEVNEELESAPDLINSSPYDNGWVLKVKDFSPQDIDQLMDAPAYTKFLEDHE